MFLDFILKTILFQRANDTELAIGNVRKTFQHAKTKSNVQMSLSGRIAHALPGLTGHCQGKRPAHPGNAGGLIYFIPHLKK